MKIVIQRVTRASVHIDHQTTAQIGPGIVILLGIEENDTLEEVNYLTKKSVNLRIFDDPNGVMNQSVIETNGEVLVVSQFTLLASTKKGNRPSYIRAARPQTAIPLYEAYCKQTELLMGKKIETGRFGADMKVELVNNGPVTILIDTNNKE